MEIKDFSSLTKYERARIIGARALQLEYGAPPLVKINDENQDTIALAKMEFEKAVLPMFVVRETTSYK